jgi:quercetin dioxygenase-like cupin family protein
VRWPLANQPAFGKLVIKRTKEMTMRRISLFVLVLLGCTMTLVGHARAQEATPAANAISLIDLAPGVTAEVLAAAPSANAPGQTVYVARFVFQPGAEIFPHSHPGTTVLGVASGRLGWTLLAGTAHVVRGAGAGGTGTEELTEPGTDVILEPGDAIFYEDDVVHTARGAGDTETVVLGSLVLDAGAPLLMPSDMDMNATPTT